MCGIAALSLDEGRGKSRGSRRMCQTIVHRGPDDEGIYVRGPAGLGMRRLSIIDVSEAASPSTTRIRRSGCLQRGDL